MMSGPLSEGALRTGLVELPGWTLSAKGDAILKSFIFADFVDAFAFMARVAVEAERQGHHPEWRNVFDRVDIRLTTHDTGDVSERDLILAKYIEKTFAGSDS